MAITILAVALLLEFSVRGLARLGIELSPPLPHSDAGFWDGNHEIFGVWHRPRAESTHTTDCFDVRYRTNSIGARDRERDARARGSRVVVLGDSFVEGWGLPVNQRLSNQLERATGIEHLNLAMAHFGPYQASLAYAEFSPRFEHDAVLVGIAPVNDFVDLDYELARGAPAYRFRYRPYLVGTYPDYAPRWHRESRLHRGFRRYSYAFNAFDWALHRSGADDAYAPPLKTGDGYFHSYFYDYSPAQFDLLRASLERIAQVAGGRRMAVFLIPAERDFARYGQSGPGPLAPALEAVAAPLGVRVVNLLPEMFQAESNHRRYFLQCDYHWNARANERAAAILQRELTPYFYTP